MRRAQHGRQNRSKINELLWRIVPTRFMFLLPNVCKTQVYHQIYPKKRKMKLLFRLSLLLLFCASQALGVKIESVPTDGDGDGVIQIELREPVSLVCQFDNSRESVDDKELVWKRNGAQISLKEENKQGQSAVCITPIQEDNDATFTCHPKKNATDVRSVTLNVTFPPQLSGSEQVTVEEEAELQLKCDIKANPLVTSATWTLNGSQVDLVEHDFIVTENGLMSELSADFVRRSLHEGTYQCLVSSPRYGQFAKTFIVTVTDKTMKFPLIPIIVGLIVLFLTAVLAVASRWKKIVKCCK